MTSPLILPLAGEDLAEVQRLDEENPTPWSRALWESELRQPGCWQWTARQAPGQPLLGFICGRTAAGEAEVFRLAVAAAHRRQGVGGSLLAHACSELGRAGVTTLFLELRVSNRPARNLYEKMGFAPIGLRVGYYTSPREDALAMSKKL